MSKCEFCGQMNPDGVELCKGCGAKISNEPSPAEPPQRVADDHRDDQPDGLESRELALLRAGNKIKAIRLHREATGLGLKESKEAMEALAGKHNVAPTGGGCAGVVLLALAVSGTLAAVCW